MSCVHYKFKSKKDYDTLTFEGVSISIADLKKEIILKQKMGKLLENFDLQISNAQTATGENYVFNMILDFRMTIGDFNQGQ